MAKESQQEIEAYLKYKRELLDLIVDKAKLENLSENYFMSFFIGYRKELDLGKQKFVKAVVTAVIANSSAEEM